MIDLQNVKHFIRVDEDFDDLLIQGLIDSSEEYLLGAGVNEIKKNTALYNLVVKMICKRIYDNEDYVNDKGIKAIIAQLVYC